jgi:hypothetical protein
MQAIQAEKQRVLSKERDIQDRDRKLQRQSVESENLRIQIREERVKQDLIARQAREASEDALRKSLEDSKLLKT